MESKVISICEEEENIIVKGHGTQPSKSPVSDYWKNWPLVKVLDYVNGV